MNVKNSIKKFSVFLIMLAIIIVFALGFGINNSSVGVMAVVLCIFLLRINLKKNLKVNFLKILITNLLIGLFAFLFYIVPSLNFLIVFIVIFLICILTKDVSSKIYYPFALEFIFLLSQNVTFDSLYIRLLALVASSILIVLINLLYHRNTPTVEKSSSNNSIKEIFTSKFRKDRNHYLFSIELALIIAIFESISFYFNIPHVKWLSITALSILQPNTNLAIKGFNRIKGTLIGVFLFIIIYFVVFKTFSSYSVFIAIALVLISAYFYMESYMGGEYYVRMIWSSLLALSSAFITFFQYQYIFDRIFFIVIGAVICLIVNYFMRKSFEI